MSQQPKLRPKTHIPGLSENWYDLATIAKLNELEYGQGTVEDRREKRVFRVKRKHVLKACDRCRVKKTKVSGLLEGDVLQKHHPSGFCRFRNSIYLFWVSVTESSLVTVARHIITPAYFGRGRPHRPRYTLEGKTAF